jgi:hypothetical protein
MAFSYGCVMACGSKPSSLGSTVHHPREKLRDDAQPATVIADQAAAQRLAILRAQRSNDLLRLGLGFIEEILLEAQGGLEPLTKRFECGDMLGVAGSAGERQEQRTLALV